MTPGSGEIATALCFYTCNFIMLSFVVALMMWLDDSTTTISPFYSVRCCVVCPDDCADRSCFRHSREQLTCCHHECLGGCSGPTSHDCFVCRHVVYQGQCLSSCPPGLYKVKLNYSSLLLQHNKHSCSSEVCIAACYLVNALTWTQAQLTRPCRWCQPERSPVQLLAQRPVSHKLGHHMLCFRVCASVIPLLSNIASVHNYAGRHWTLFFSPRN